MADRIEVRFFDSSDESHFLCSFSFDSFNDLTDALKEISTEKVELENSDFVYEFIANEEVAPAVVVPVKQETHESIMKYYGDNGLTSVRNQ